MSFQAQEGVLVAFENIVNYVRMLTIFGRAKVRERDCVGGGGHLGLPSHAKEVPVERRLCWLRQEAQTNRGPVFCCR